MSNVADRLLRRAPLRCQRGFVPAGRTRGPSLTRQSEPPAGAITGECPAGVANGAYANLAGKVVRRMPAVAGVVIAGLLVSGCETSSSSYEMPGQVEVLVADRHLTLYSDAEAPATGLPSANVDYVPVESAAALSSLPDWVADLEPRWNAALANWDGRDSHTNKMAYTFSFHPKQLRYGKPESALGYPWRTPMEVADVRSICGAANADFLFALEWVFLRSGMVDTTDPQLVELTCGFALYDGHTGKLEDRFVANADPGLLRMERHRQRAGVGGTGLDLTQLLVQQGISALAYR